MIELIKTALARFELAEDAEADFRRSAKEDLDFVAGNQWNWQARNVRENAGLPCFTVNRLPTFLNQILNEMRQNKPALQVDPVSGGATREVADALAGLMRQIEQHSAADTAYQTAAWYQVASGVGYFRLGSEYENYENNDQRLVIQTIDDPARVYMDPNSREVDGSDQEWCFIVSDMPKDEYKREFGESTMAGMLDARAFRPDSRQEDWITESTVRIAEYYYKTYEKKTLYTIRAVLPDLLPYVQSEPDLLLDPASYETVYDYNKPPKELVEMGAAVIVSKREVQVPTIHLAKINAVEVLEETIWPGEFIPVFPVKGNEFYIDGKKQLHGAIRFTKDTQRSLNWFTSVQAEVVGMAPKAPFVGGKGAFAGFEHLWRDVNVSPIAYLEFNDKDPKGNPITPPQRVQAEAPIQAISQSRAQASDDLKAVFGIFDPSLGAQGNETSGVAILARTEQSHISNYHYYDNLVRAITHLGRVMVQVIPFFYDNERVVRIVNPNGTTEVKTINDPMGKLPFGVGKYEVIIQTGPTYATRRQEAVEKMVALGGAYPQAMPAIADIVVNEMDWPGASMIADRLRAMVPQEILQATGELETEDSNMDPQQLVKQQRMMLQKQQQALEALNAHAQQVEQQLQLLAEENKLMKMDKEIDLVKAEMDTTIKTKQLELEEATTKLEFLVKEKELEFQDRKLKIEEAHLAITGVNAMTNIDKSVLETEKTMMETMKSMPDLTKDMAVGEGPKDLDFGGKFGGDLGGKID